MMQGLAYLSLCIALIETTNCDSITRKGNYVHSISKPGSVDKTPEVDVETLPKKQL